MSVGYDRIARDIAFTTEVKSPKIFENILLNNGVLVLLGAGGRVKIVRGSNRFDERVHLGQNSNVGFRSKFGQVPVNFQDNYQTAYYGQAVISGAVPINLVEEDQNAGEHRIDSLADTLIEELKMTFPNKVSDALMAATSGATDPISLVETLPATAYGAQTTPNTGGIARSAHLGTDPTDAWQTQYDSTAGKDFGTAAGIELISNFLYTCSPGGSALTEQPDICLVKNGCLAEASSAMDILRMYGASETLLKYGFDSVKINRCSFIGDRNAVANTGLALNTNYMHAQVLAGPKTKTVGGVKAIGDGAVEIPLQVRPPVESEDYLNYTIKAYMVFNVTFGSLRNHGRMAGLSY
jgi:hypothetical protein